MSSKGKVAASSTALVGLELVRYRDRTDSADLTMGRSVQTARATPSLIHQQRNRDQKGLHIKCKVESSLGKRSAVKVFKSLQ
jgi:hypothetical protein